ncbi:MAG: DUF1826 domain-containing protein [Parasphingorhabdus sp.]
MSVAVRERSIALIAGNTETLNAIRDESVSIALWERVVSSSLSKLNLDSIADVRFTASVDALPDALSDALDEADHQRGSARDILHKDILVLANRFAQVMETEYVEIRLEHITTNACRKFHTDYVTARLITTYLGQGTEWLDSDEHGNSEPSNVQQMRTGDVALFKGRLWSSHAPAVHRSPPIEGTGEERLVLVINPARFRDTD